jgi:hypothetical protein
VRGAKQVVSFRFVLFQWEAKRQLGWAVEFRTRGRFG